MGSYITYEYGRHGQVVAAIDPYGQERSWSYDDAGRLIGLVSPESSTMLDTPAGMQSASFAYYGDDLLREKRVSEGATSTFDSVANRTWPIPCV